MIKELPSIKQMKDIEIRNAKVPRPAILFIKEIIKGPLIGAEIGVQLGKNAQSILQTLNIKKLYLIDPYIHYKENIFHVFQDFSQAFTEAKQRLSLFKDKIRWIIMKSSVACNIIPDGLDFVYIDGNHTYDFVKQDIENYWPKIKKGGVLSGHDYFMSSIILRDKVVGGVDVKKAVDEFVQKNNLKLYLKTPDWWIVK